MPAVATKKRFFDLSAAAHDGPIRYRGFLTDVHQTGAFGFVLEDTVRQLTRLDKKGFAFDGDIMVHVRQNRALGDPLPADTWVIFSIIEDARCESGYTAIGAEIDPQQD